MNNRILRATLVAALLMSLLLGACGPELPREVKVNVVDMWAKDITLNALQSAFTGNNLTPPLYEQRAGTTLYAVVVSFDIPTLPEGVDFKVVTVIVNAVKDTGESGYPENEDARVVTPIPISVDRTSDVTATTKFAASITATIEAVSGTLGAEQSTSESYQKIYRSVTAHVSPSHEVYWEFKPFLDEPVQPGLYYVVAVYEVPASSTGNLFFASAGCSYGTSGESNPCTVGANQRVTVP